MSKDSTPDGVDEAKAREEAEVHEAMRLLFGYWLRLRSDYEGRPVEGIEDGPVVCCGQTWQDIRSHITHGLDCPTIAAVVRNEANDSGASEAAT